MKSKILSFLLLLCASTVFSQTIINYPLEEDLDYSYAEPGTLPHTIGYYKSDGTPEAPLFVNPTFLWFDLGRWMAYRENNDYIELTFQRNGYDELAVDFDVGIYDTGTADFQLYWIDGASTAHPIGDEVNLGTLFWPVSKHVTRTIPAAALTGTSVTIRITGTSFTLGWGNFGIRHLEIATNKTNLSVKRNDNAFPEIPYNSEASSVYDTDFGSWLTMEEHTTKEFLITNTGEKDLIIDHFEIIQSDNDFSFEGALPEGTTTPEDGTQTFKIRFEPQDQGLKIAEIRIYANILPHNPFVFKVIGYGKSCNLVPVPIATQHFENTPQNLDYSLISGTLRMINGNSKKHEHTPFDNSDL